MRTAAAALVALLACSPEATRTRDGGPGGDIGNKQVVEAELPNAQPADTTLMPGKAPAPVTRFEKGGEAK
ncbi:MAG: hypothetical protein ACT4P6_01045 [Gemmatimonadaceae bacterium]